MGGNPLFYLSPNFLDVSTTKFEKAKNKIRLLLSTLEDKDFFKENHISLDITSATYIILKKSYKKYGASNKSFQNVFSQFYGLRRFVDNEFVSKYFKKMEELREESFYDIRKLTEELVDNDGRVQFSFATKLLNIINDEIYPIYDGNVAKAFGIYAPDSKNIKEKIDGHINNYLIIGSIYRDLLVENASVISAYRDFFNYSVANLSDMRVLDIIVWKLGEKLLKK